MAKLFEERTTLDISPEFTSKLAEKVVEAMQAHHVVQISKGTARHKAVDTASVKNADLVNYVKASIHRAYKLGLSRGKFMCTYEITSSAEEEHF